MSSLHSKQYSVAELNTSKEKVFLYLMVGGNDKSSIKTFKAIRKLNYVEKE